MMNLQRQFIRFLFQKFIKNKTEVTIRDKYGSLLIEITMFGWVVGSRTLDYGKRKTK